MVALEAKPLPTLPWAEIDPSGPILILVVPQVNTEIDKRKRDGRLGKRAREFNRLIAPAAESGTPNRISGGSPAVDIAIARTTRINWDNLDDLDPAEPDARVVAQILHARDVPDERKLLLSHDTNPIAMASRHGLRCRRLPESWLLEPEPSPNEKEVTRLKARVKELEASEPNLALSLTFDVSAPVGLFRVQKLSEEQRKLIVSANLHQNPRIRQERSFTLSGFGYDSDYDDKYETYRKETLSKYAASVHRFLETHYGQVPFTFELANTGHLQAENLVLTLKATGGTLHDRFTIYPIFGPNAPQPRPYRLDVPLLRPHDFHPRVVGRHAIDFAVGPDRGELIEVHCADFRHERRWAFEGLATIDPHAASPFVIEATVTAANMRGVVKDRYELEHTAREADVGDLIDFGERSYKVPFPMAERFEAAITEMDMTWLQFIKVDGMTDEDMDDEE